MAEYQASYDEIRSLGAQLVALSVDPPERSAALRASLGLQFPLLCDPGREVVEGWGLLNPYEHGGIAYPAVFVLDAARVVRYRSLDRLASRVSSGELLAFLRGKHSAVAPRRSLLLPGLRWFWQAFLNVLRFGARSPRWPCVAC